MREKNGYYSHSIATTLFPRDKHSCLLPLRRYLMSFTSALSIFFPVTSLIVAKTSSRVGRKGACDSFNSAIVTCGILFYFIKKMSSIHLPSNILPIHYDISIDTRGLWSNTEFRFQAHVEILINVRGFFFWCNNKSMKMCFIEIKK